MDGYFLIDKDTDWTSSDVVSKLRGILHEKKIGHGGTLDPLATGLLVIMAGKATKTSEKIMGHDKEYIATMRLGISTDTQDITGNVLAKKEVSVSEDDVKAATEAFIGDITQIPPMYSAIKIKGKKLYEIARKGGEVERKPRNLHIESIDILSHEGNDYILKINCSSGTYIRTLCNDIGEKLGCGATMAALRRTRVGQYRIEDAHRISEIKDWEYLIPLVTPETEI